MSKEFKFYSGKDLLDDRQAKFSIDGRGFNCKGFNDKTIISKRFGDVTIDKAIFIDMDDFMALPEKEQKRIVQEEFNPTLELLNERLI